MSICSCTQSYTCAGCAAYGVVVSIVNKKDPTVEYAEKILQELTTIRTLLEKSPNI